MHRTTNSRLQAPVSILFLTGLSSSYRVLVFLIRGLAEAWSRLDPDDPAAAMIQSYLNVQVCVVIHKLLPLENLDLRWCIQGQFSLKLRLRARAGLLFRRVARSSADDFRLHRRVGGIIVVQRSKRSACRRRKRH